MWEERSCRQTREWQHWGSGCYKYRCDNGRLHILVSATKDTHFCTGNTHVWIDCVFCFRWQTTRTSVFIQAKRLQCVSNRVVGCIVAQSDARRVMKYAAMNLLWETKHANWAKNHRHQMYSIKTNFFVVRLTQCIHPFQINCYVHSFQL